MKKIIMLLVVMVMLISGIVYAAETSGATYNSPNGYADGLATWLNDQEYIDHNHQYAMPETERNDPYGVGADVIVWQSESKNVAVEVQAKYDIPNKETSGFVVAKLNLFEILKKKTE